MFGFELMDVPVDLNAILGVWNIFRWERAPYENSLAWSLIYQI